MDRYSTYAETLQTSDGVNYLSGLPFMDFIYDGREVFHKVTETEENRLDLIAYKYFNGDTSLWYAIALYNSITDPLNIAIGTVLAIPVDAQTNAKYIPFTYAS